jgi:hypothetical protein
VSGSLEVRITVRRRLSARVVSSFDGLRAIRTRGRTTLVGEVADQAQLHAWLTHARDLGLELECVAVYSDEEVAAPAEPEPRPREGVIE